MSDQFASGNWVVNRGRESDFVLRWTEFLQWTRSCAPGLVSASLIQDAGDSRHFISFARWESQETMESWRSMPDFQVKLAACRGLCDDFRGSSYTEAAVV
jgi:heme-degrading monooxygenase HmoA